ncbi:MAG: hypothetical protein AB4368_02660 [Xenococcaceae cyanobacterium]
MIDLNKVKTLAESYSAQELFAALVYQRGKFNNFDGEEVITDLVNRPDLWCSFLFAKAIYAPDADGISFALLIDTLVAMANHQIQPAFRNMLFIEYPADTLYILTENQDTKICRLLDFGKKWQADSVEVVDGNTEVDTEETKWRKYIRLNNTLFKESCWDRQDGVVVTYWWD